MSQEPLWSSENGRYRLRHGRFERRTRQGWQPLCNFSARIVESREVDTGDCTFRIFVIEGRLEDGTPLPPIEVPAVRYRSRRWISQWSGAIVEPGTAWDHLRVAIQLYSMPIPARPVFWYTGWRCIDGCWHYLHDAGVICATGAAAAVQVDLDPELQVVSLPDPGKGICLKEAVRAVLDLRRAMPGFAWTLIGAAFRAPLGRCDTVLCLGHSRNARAAAMLAQAFFGASAQECAPPVYWNRHDKGMELIFARARDVLLWVDGFDARGVSRLAELLGIRRKATPSGELAAVRRPEGLLLLTCDRPLPESIRPLRGRLWLDRPRAIRDDALQACRRAAENGYYAVAMAAYVRYLAERFDTVGADPFRLLRDERNELAHAMILEGVPGHLAHPASDLLQGAQRFLDFAVTVGAVGHSQAAALYHEARQQYCTTCFFGPPVTDQL